MNKLKTCIRLGMLVIAVGNNAAPKSMPAHKSGYAGQTLAIASASSVVLSSLTLYIILWATGKLKCDTTAAANSSSITSEQYKALEAVALNNELYKAVFDARKEKADAPDEEARKEAQKAIDEAIKEANEDTEAKTLLAVLDNIKPA